MFASFFSGYTRRRSKSAKIGQQIARAKILTVFSHKKLAATRRKLLRRYPALAVIAMRELFRLPSAIAIATTFKERSRVTFGAKLIFWPLAVLTLVAVALHLGAWKKEFKIAGPFAAEANPARHSFILAVPQEGRAAWWRQPLLGRECKAL
jgi:hypothetical protein